MPRRSRARSHDVLASVFRRLALNVTNPDASVQVTEDFLGRRTRCRPGVERPRLGAGGQLGRGGPPGAQRQDHFVPGNLAEADAAVLDEQFVDLGGEG